MAERADRTPNLQAVAPGEAIIGGVRAAWVTPPIRQSAYGTTIAFALGDFTWLAAYLARSTDPETYNQTAKPFKWTYTGKVLEA